ncbi:hypothetical protein vseg_004732 [Gypsophila vaccaria]
MALTFTTIILIISHFVLQLSAENQARHKNCPSSFQCAGLGILGYPFTPSFNPSCGLCVLNCTEPVQTIGLTNDGPWYDVLNSFSSNTSFIVGDPLLLHILNDKCDVTKNGFRLPNSSSVKFTPLWNKKLWSCQNASDAIKENRTGTLSQLTGCNDHNVYHSSNKTLDLTPGCQVVLYPTLVMVDLSDQCSQCVSESGSCQDLPNDGFRCINERKGRRRRRLILGLGISGGSIGILVLALICWYRKKIKLQSLALTSRSISREPRRMKTDLEVSNIYFSVPVFSYGELEEATNNFDSSRELGDGGFGTVYYGRLKDGREVAVKRLYERNYRRLEQFMNEIELLAGLRHQNLVSLYGCTSRRSKELLLVYEYVPNGTVADHLTGDQANCGILTWPIRLSIAIETANALSYLHSSDIIHRDIKSNNILLDNNFRVRVADFGLSRLFPMDVTHISTAPQGTPGYLDPEYHQCYQLTEKSDVYSFGVVLAELISSLPAIDISREQDEINLSVYAMKRIQTGALEELVDPRLKFKTNNKTRRMITQVAELAFQCLQQRKELRPSMIEVVEALKTIESVDCDGQIAGVQEKSEKISTNGMDGDCTWLLRNTENPTSPNSVMQKWGSSKSTTPTASK